MTQDKKEILIVDDEVDFRLDLAEILVDHGFNVTTAANGAEALRHLKFRNPDLITFDLKMPVQDGMRFREELERMDKKIPLIMITGWLPKQLSRLNGVRAFFTKPLDRESFLMVLNHCLKEEEYS